MDRFNSVITLIEDCTNELIRIFENTYEVLDLITARKLYQYIIDMNVCKNSIIDLLQSDLNDRHGLHNSLVEYVDQCVGFINQRREIP